VPFARAVIDVTGMLHGEQAAGRLKVRIVKPEGADLSRQRLSKQVPAG
jgi:hypothetical protein